MLTNEQIKLVEDNVAFAYHIAKRFINTSIEYEDLCSIARYGLVKAAATYDPSTGYRFTTYASVIIQNEILLTLRKSRHSYEIISLDYEYGDDKEMKLQDIIEDPINRYENVEILLDYRKFLNSVDNILDKREMQLFQLIVEHPGMAQRYYAECIGIQQPRVSKLLKQIRQKFIK